MLMSLVIMPLILLVMSSLLLIMPSVSMATFCFYVFGHMFLGI